MKIAVCPGHHQAAQGAANGDITEWQVMTVVAQHLVKLLPDADVIQGRLPQKVVTINDGLYDLTLDLHLNASAKHNVSGCMVLAVPGNTERLKQAETLSSEISAMLGNQDLGGREGFYWGGKNPGKNPDYFLSRTRCPAFILEPYYIDTELERWLGDETYVAQAIAHALEVLYE